MIQIMKKIHFIAIILFILAPFTSLCQEGKLKVMSYNIRMGGANDGDNSWLDELDKMMTSTRKIALKSDNEGTFNGWGRGSSVIDYIYVSGFGKVVEYRTIKESWGGIPYISDHYPIISVLEF